MFGAVIRTRNRLATPAALSVATRSCKLRLESDIRRLVAVLEGFREGTSHALR